MSLHDRMKKLESNIGEFLIEVLDIKKELAYITSMDEKTRNFTKEFVVNGIYNVGETSKRLLVKISADKYFFIDMSDGKSYCIFPNTKKEIEDFIEKFNYKYTGEVLKDKVWTIEDTERISKEPYTMAKRDTWR